MVHKPAPRGLYCAAQTGGSRDGFERRKTSGRTERGFVQEKGRHRERMRREASERGRRGVRSSYVRSS